MAKPFDDKKHPRDVGKFSRIPGGKGRGEDEGGPFKKSDYDESQVDPRVLEARRTVEKHFPGGFPEDKQVDPSLPRDSRALRGLGASAGSGYRSAQKAVVALHGSGDLQAMHHHGKILQDAIKGLKVGGAKPEEIEKLRHALTGLHSALVRNDKVGAHQALSELQHGFYHAHSSFQKEYGVGGFPLIGPAEEAKEAETRAAEASRPLLGSTHPQGGRQDDASLSPEEYEKAHVQGAPRLRTKSEMAIDEAPGKKKFSLDDLPAKPTPEDFDKAVKGATNLKIAKWDHRFIPHDRIDPSENKEPDPELVKKIKTNHNSVPPIVVRPVRDEDRYNILDGHHRYFASKKAGHKGMWAVVVKDGDYS